MQLNFLGKALIASTSVLLATKVIERLVEEETPAPQQSSQPYTGQQLLNMLDRMSLNFFKLAAKTNNNWEQFNKMVDASPVRPANYYQRCEMWELCRQ
jgi:hypothetical protein